MEERELKALLGNNIKLYRFQRQISQAELADRMGISITFLSNVERGNNFPKASTLCNLAKGLGVEIWELFRGAEAPDPGRTKLDRLTDDVFQQVNQTLKTIFDHYRAAEPEQ